MSTQTAAAAVQYRPARAKGGNPKAVKRDHAIYISVTAEYGSAVREVADLLGISMSEAGNEAFALWLAARRKEFAKGLTPSK
jgi:hypothetical protein